MFKRVIIHSKKYFMLPITIIFLVVLCTSSYATNGYFAHGYGTKYMALAGAGVALSLEVPGLQTIELNMKQWQFSLAFSF